LKSQVGSWHIKVAAEAVTAAQFARCGFNVSVQYGADQPEYDLVVVKGNQSLKVSVKGSQDGSWGLTQSYLQRADYHQAIEAWLARHHLGTVFCFVQYKNTVLNELPRMYLANPKEVGERLKATANGRGDTILYEHHDWTKRARGAGTVERIPDAWRFTEERVEFLLSECALKR